jgi:hypothetical protein
LPEDVIDVDSISAIAVLEELSEFVSSGVWLPLFPRFMSDLNLNFNIFWRCYEVDPNGPSRKTSAKSTRYH